MALIGTTRRRFWRLLLSGSWLCVVVLMVFRIVQENAKITYRSLMFSNDESPEDECDCNKIIQGDRDELRCAQIQTLTKSFRNITRITDEQYIKQTEDCENFRKTRKYLPFPLSVEEKAFPVAYSIVIHHKVQNFERLLRAIYSPQNFYCVHVDKKAPESTRKAISSIVSCFNNVFLASKTEAVVYASWSRVQADINCMKDLYQISSSWKYFINLCGQDFPIKTNLEIVHALKALRGANSLETQTTPDIKGYRWKISYKVRHGTIWKTNQAKSPPPFGLKVFSGNTYIVVSRDFVRYVLENPKAQVLISWINDTYSPDEFLWATMQRMPGVPGFLRAHSKFDVTDIYSISRLIKWQGHEGAFDELYPACQGIHIRGVCVFGVGDLQWILEQHHLFANKFDTDFDPVAIRCLEKYLRHKALKKLRIGHLYITPLNKENIPF
ncbi:beta-1,3-galactosyl-O-glycosyl-glycoprotein beta-1,6-N-acetylglucosaminyltransferase-like [Hemibagrus wyckioides]|uniref:beta-1,3-galactosyl-O-glycosyl-glycoprotein beta-1,6-N-acetylglucosaminyltransferase-like n=1 Tax=Hemibagrus wyckioides TaxID=337641 RepID=UPI00266D8160|nr:beta-1,3-galactosyl-O-glycosyl-glycoprotein beta-1,6-N-acetylglucosaminyltransferase-like [Hemibagrus wyckioides]XP_058245459.1 beta-1,3-galactosyl-O-glycosyl-glycoprotein beta-1,6-N-acetylglucosaminyltransferase-like [Hemibagrus wyckioides]XP_058245460.1 beta-1,3-galactosyl-O-glycosyl-glycoprotein beta-1,6-N-acetylglucosaminyltransferase-like [Hemibagrus wyckioides]